MFVVGGNGYVGSALVGLAPDGAVVVSRAGIEPGAIAWSDLPRALDETIAPVIVWLLDGAKHDEPARLAELIEAVPPGAHVAYVSTCTVYGYQPGDPCAEDTPLELLAPHARVKAAGEQALADAQISTTVLRLGALYGPDPRGIRRDRVEQWLTEARDHGTVTVPDPAHWRGWLHRDQAARALLAAARMRVAGVFNVSSADATFAGAARPAADWFAAQVVGADAADPLNYRIDSTRAREAGILSVLPDEDLPACITAFAKAHWPGANNG
ncbi:nucleoside-diphosphate-sugar epimerase [Promicromonospora sp. AC04]|uniref:NAD-dependent epimerase/dehydratase family protein n=1 Tax=Promicromonospora sp. AC04 TaxID=2135723 RepID=UPI000D35BBFE|nr:NAD-dependent epimerase/dehydratase family protein [Promicromonospora sp. AC04]PUB30124.1 nucleoside-diphosphate-sugar epimerase [Promicromonospora sp. AC04]